MLLELGDYVSLSVNISIDAKENLSGLVLLQLGLYVRFQPFG